MKNIISITLVFLLFFSLSVLPAEAKARKNIKVKKNKIINCSVTQSTASKLFIGSGNCYTA